MDIEELIKEANTGDMKAQNELGKAYYNGENIEQDYEKAFFWFTKAADQGLSNA